MTQDEAKALLVYIGYTFPEAVNGSPEWIDGKAETWADILGGYAFNTCKGAVKEYIRRADQYTRKEGPLPGEILQLIEEPDRMARLNEGQAWTLVSKAIRSISWDSDEVFDRLPEEVREAVGSARQLRIWGMDEDYSEPVTQSNFQRAYRAVLARRESMKRMNPAVREKIEAVIEGKMHPVIKAAPLIPSKPEKAELTEEQKAFKDRLRDEMKQNLD